MCTCEGTQPGNGSQPKQSEKHVQMGGGGDNEGQSIRSQVKRTSVWRNRQQWQQWAIAYMKRSDKMSKFIQDHGI